MYIKAIIMSFMHPENKISIDSKVSFNAAIGVKNVFSSSRFSNSKVGNNCRLNGSSVFSSQLGSRVKVGSESFLFSVNLTDDTVIGERCLLTESSVGRFTYFAGGSRVFYTDIGSFCSIAENVIIGHAEHPLNRISTSPLFYKSNNEFGNKNFVVNEQLEFKRTKIGSDVWIGANAFIRTGVNVGHGAVVGAGAVVTKDVAPYSVVGGVPAAIIRKRFDDETIEKLLKIEWWNWTLDLIEKNKSLFNLNLENGDLLKRFSNGL
jgi:acetyltransferase-like isoleucine patch superfamily enzyme